MIKENNKDILSSRKLAGENSYIDKNNDKIFYINFLNLERVGQRMKILVKFRWQNNKLFIEHAWGYQDMADLDNTICPYEIANYLDKSGFHDEAINILLRVREKEEKIK